MQIRFLLMAGWLLSLGALAQPNAPQPNPRRVLVTDLTRIRQVGNVVAAPDGRRAVYTLQTIEPNPDQPGVATASANRPGVATPVEYDYRTHLYLTNLRPDDARALTSGTESIRQPVWSPDGTKLAFVRNVKGKGQLFVLPLDGGEAQQLTSLPYGAGNPQWSPDGGWLLFSANVSMAELLSDSVLNPARNVPAWSLEKPGFLNNNFARPNASVKPNPDGSLAEIRAYLDKDVADKKAKVINRLNFQGEATTEPELGFTHLYVVEARPGATPRPITRGFTTFQASNWLPNGRYVVAVTDRDTLRHPDREVDNAIVVIPVEGGPRRTLLAEAGKSYFAPEPSPDGRWLAFLVSPSEGVNAGQIGLASLSSPVAADGPALSDVTTVPFDRSAGNFRWANVVATPPSGGRGRRSGASTTLLYFTAPSNGGFPLYRLDPATRQVTQLTDFESGIGSFDVVGGRVLMARTTAYNPSELFLADALAKNPVKLTSHNDWVAQRALSRPEKRTYKNTKGQVVDYWIMRPTFTETDKKYPLMLQMHGGPTAMWGPGEASMWHEFQYFCGQGYGIVYANPRGSGGYGLNFQRGNYQDWGTGPAEDVLAAATDAARESWVDTSRQVITGGSYAGYLTAWIVAHDHRFKAAFAQRGVYDLTTFLGEGNAWRLVPAYFGYPWQAGVQPILEANSPYTFVQNIRTPLLIKHGENDLRTGVIQSEMLYKSLKILGRPVEYVRMPGATHELSRSGNVRQRIDRILRIYEFFERYVGPDAQGLTQK